ncbi:MAG: hypothetical protein NTZ56_04565 [Acidobacteria bacterium]|nr:hypothetical protein [Acidobacteriota bacterium]
MGSAARLDLLNPYDIEILWALWDDLYRSDVDRTLGHRKAGLTREQLENILVKRSPEDSRLFKTRSALNKHLTRLKTLSNLVSTASTAARRRDGSVAPTGDRRDVYALYEGEAITWATTARIVLEVWNSPGHHINQRGLVNRMTQLGLRREPDSSPLTENTVLADVQYAIDKGYLNRYEDDLRADVRLGFEIGYISRIAGYAITAGHTAANSVTNVHRAG